MAHEPASGKVGEKRAPEPQQGTERAPGLAKTWRTDGEVARSRRTLWVPLLRLHATAWGCADPGLPSRLPAFANARSPGSAATPSDPARSAGRTANPLELRSLGRALEGWRAERERRPPSPPLSPLSPLLRGKRGPGTRTNPQSSRPRGSPDSPSEPSRREPDGLRTRAPSPPLQPCAHSRCEQTVAMEKRVPRKESAPGPPCPPPASPEPPPSCAGSSRGAPPGPCVRRSPGTEEGDGRRRD